ncbi:Uncharacterised protein [Mycobacterium tuberculosis]|uniref:Uncharacterized protein n=1 Tax=Mycobacterium tuberculosis TaxID=1773 RepID=A0A916LD13_MYCTX|nr:Uncharacterised protein [Mycobacterium tuberculosis]
MNSSVAVWTSTAPALCAIRCRSWGVNVCRSTRASSAAAREDSSSSPCGRRQPLRPGSLVALVTTRQVSVDSVRA